MTQEEKQLLMRDLSARFPYGVKIIDEPAHCLGELFLISTTDMVEYETETDTGMQTIYNIKPYLRPLSSMTEEEEESLREDTGLDIFKCTVNKELEDLWTTDCSVKDLFCLSSWLNEHHFDYNGLIEKGLALEAPADMYKNG